MIRVVQRTGWHLFVFPTGVTVVVVISQTKPVRIPLGILKFGSWEEQGLFIPPFAGEAGSTRATTLIPWGHSCSLVQGSRFYPHLHGQQPHLAWTWEQGYCGNLSASLDGFLSDLFLIEGNWEYPQPEQTRAFKKQTVWGGRLLFLLLPVLNLGKVHISLCWEQDKWNE